MVHRTILAWMLVGAFLVAPSAVASFEDTETPLAGLLGLPPVPEAPLEDPVVKTVQDTVATVAQTLDDATTCRPAARLGVQLIGGDILARRDHASDFLLTRDVTTIVGTLEVPVYQTVTETVWSPSGLLSFLDPVTREVQRLVGTDIQEIVEERSIDYAVQAQWQERYIDWSDEAFTIYVAPVIGLPLGGSLAMVCGIEVLDTVPTFPNPGHDYWRVTIGDPETVPEDGWYLGPWSVVVDQATAAQSAEWPVAQNRISIGCPLAAYDDANAQADRLAGSDDPPALEPTDSGADPEPQAAASAAGNPAAVSVPTGTLAFLASVAMAGVGLVGYGWRRMR